MTQLTVSPSSNEFPRTQDEKNSFAAAERENPNFLCLKEKENVQEFPQKI